MGKIDILLEYIMITIILFTIHNVPLAIFNQLTGNLLLSALISNIIFAMLLGYIITELRNKQQ